MDFVQSEMKARIPQEMEKFWSSCECYRDRRHCAI